MKKYIGMGLFILALSAILMACGGDEKDEATQPEAGAENVDREENNDVEQEDAEQESDEVEKTDNLTDLSVTETDNEPSQEEDDSSEDTLKLNEIHGVISEKEAIHYDDEKGYHVLELTAGFSNNTNTQDVNEKWVAFAIPNGLSVPDVEEIPSGMVLVSLPDGHTGIAIKVPNVKGIKYQADQYEIPLMGAPDDNSPNENIYLYDVDVNTGQATLVGEINSTREIDFSVMEEV